MSMKQNIEWSREAEEAFTSLKLALTGATVLSLPDYSKPFVQTVDWKGHFMTSILAQQTGGCYKPVAYYSKRLDPVACVLPSCVRAVCAAALAEHCSAEVVLFHTFELLVPHAVGILLTQTKMSFLAPARHLSILSTHGCDDLYWQASGACGALLCANVLHTPNGKTLFHSFAGLVERTNGTVKLSLKKTMEQTGRSWPEFLDLVEMYMRITPTGNGLTPFEIIYGRPFVLPIMTDVKEKKESQTLAEWMTNLLKEKEIVNANKLPDAALSQQEEKIEPGDQILIKAIKQKTWSSLRWEEPYTVVLTTRWL
ncbi:uncharacterized protein LOC114868409 [Betta splendens]|uniref:Uncharacterized protein LOC114868409 n=1 Tax=Betta splendens TaxID=158456 RepID=A0A6P7PCS6_BETSP|nr:uncharacterized protein LOC114868409 [Betta splendens]